MKKIMILRTFALFTFLVSTVQANAPAGRYTDETGAALTGPSVQVKDTVTGLIWQRAYGSGKTWSASSAAGSAQLYCAQLAIGAQGAGSWRLPTIKELTTLVDVTASSGATIDLVAFLGTPANYFWSSTVYQPNSASAWIVNFGGGAVVYGSISGSYFVRCVR